MAQGTIDDFLTIVRVVQEWALTTHKLVMDQKWMIYRELNRISDHLNNPVKDEILLTDHWIFTNKVKVRDLDFYNFRDHYPDGKDYGELLTLSWRAHRWQSDQKVLKADIKSLNEAAFWFHGKRKKDSVLRKILRIKIDAEITASRALTSN